MTGSHRCIAGRDCRRAELVDGRRAGALTEKPDTLCQVCHKHISSAIHQLPRDYRELRDTLGERATNTGQRIRSTPTPAIPISTRKEALMAEIVDMCDRAAAIVSDRLGTEQPTGRRKPPQKAATGSIAWCQAMHRQPHPQQSLRAAISVTEPNIELLAAAPAEPALVWVRPKRCPKHRQEIRGAKVLLEAIQLPAAVDMARQMLNLAYTAAGQCDDCNGWWRHGQQRQLVEQSGLEITLQLVELHNQARAELGLTRLRHVYKMPCPNCGAQVGRDDGTTIVDCKKCESSWTEREYKFLVGLITHERLDMEILKYLLAEAYGRLDDVQRRLDVITDADLTLPCAGEVIVEAMRQALGDHKRPADRAIATTREATQERQTSDDSWAWRNETPYRPPRPRHKRQRVARPAGPPIHPGSLTTLVDIDEDAVLNGDARCHDCNTIHAGECP